MAETLTANDSFPATIQMPTAGEVVSAADLRDKAIQPLANLSEYIRPRYIELSVSGTGVAAAQRFSLSNGSYVTQSGDFTLDIVDDDVEVHDAGVYEFHIYLKEVTHAGTNNPQEVAVSLYYDDGTENIINAIRTYRYSATASDEVSISGYAVATLGAGDKILLTATGGTMSISGYSILVIRRIA